MRERLLLLTAALAFASLAARAEDARGAVAGLKKDRPYAEMRQKLLNAGWFAAPQDPAQFADQRCGARAEICDAYPETEACSGTGMGFCAFRFRSGDGAIIAVTTVGEGLADLTVYGWREE